MEIDIIDLTDPNYQSLSSVQLAMVRTAQKKKNKLLAEAQEEKQAVKLLLLSQKTARSTMLQESDQAIDARVSLEIEVVKMDLEYQLIYEGIGSDGNEYGPYRYPENPNYNLTYPQRFIVVRTFYMNLSANAEARLQAYSMDSLARTYLGEYYQTLYELLASYVH